MARESAKKCWKRMGTAIGHSYTCVRQGLALRTPLRSVATVDSVREPCTWERCGRWCNFRFVLRHNQHIARRLDLRNLVNDHAANFSLYDSVLAVPNFSMVALVSSTGCRNRNEDRKSTWRYYDICHSGAMCLIFTLLKRSCEC